MFLYRNGVQMLKESELKVLDHLTLSSDGKGFISQIARDIGMSKGEVSKAVKVLKQGGLVRSQLSGRNVVCFIDRASPVIARLRTAFNLLELIPKVEPLLKHVEKIIVFGSCAQGTDKFENEIDIFVITREKDKVIKMAQKIRLSRPTQWVVKTPQEYVVFNNKEKVFADEISQGIVLWEAYEASRV